MVLFSNTACAKFYNTNTPALDFARARPDQWRLTVRDAICHAWGGVPHFHWLIRGSQSAHEAPAERLGREY